MTNQKKKNAKMKISIGSDHRGVALKARIIQELSDITWQDVGTNSGQRTDYPIYAKKVVDDIKDATSDFGILICGSGVGMAVAANREKGIYAALCFSPEIARVAHQDDGVNVLALSSDYCSDEENLAIARAMIAEWAAGSFKGGRYAERLEMLDN